MALNGVIALILRFSAESDSFAGQLRHSGWRYTYNVRKILSLPVPVFHFWPKSTHPAASGVTLVRKVGEQARGAEGS